MKGNLHAGVKKWSEIDNYVSLWLYKHTLFSSKFCPFESTNSYERIQLLKIYNDTKQVKKSEKKAKIFQFDGK